MTDRKENAPPKIFISYSHDSPEHKAWVLQLATRLREDGVDVTLDQWNLSLGGNQRKFIIIAVLSSVFYYNF